MLPYRYAKMVAMLVGRLFHRRTFKSFGRRSFIVRPLDIAGKRYIEIGDGVRIRDHLRMEAIDKMRRPELVIGDNTNIEQNVHIICSALVRIGPNCSITAGCSIVDTSHPFDGVGDVKFADLLNPDPAHVLIDEGCLIGTGAVVLPNVHLGRRCVVGANAVVAAGDYPPGSVLAGAPAKVIRQLRIDA